MDQKAGFLEDGSGNSSSKRLWGSILLTFGMALSLSLFVWALIHPENLYSTNMTIVEVFIGWGSGLLGIGIAENFFNKCKNDGKQ